MKINVIHDEKWRECPSVVSYPVRPHRLYSPRNSPGQDTGVGSHSLCRGPSQPGDLTQVSCIAGGFFTNWALQKPKNAGVCSLSLLQQIFPTQDRTRVSCIAAGFFTSWATREFMILTQKRNYMQKITWLKSSPFYDRNSLKT